MSNLLGQMLLQRDWLLADGATGTSLFNKGLGAGEAAELWNESRPDLVCEVYRDAVSAGADLFLTNSYGGNAVSLARKGVTGRVRELNRLAASLGRDVADGPAAAGRKVLVAGNIGPSEEILAPMGRMSHAEAVELFHEQAEALKEGGADLLWAETISSREEYRAIGEAASRANMAWVGTMNFDTAGRTMMGVTSVQLASYVKKMSNPPVAFGANCGMGVADLLRALLGFGALQDTLPIVAKGNAGLAKFHAGHIHYDGTPELMADYAVMARDAGARIIGGCCGTMPAHLRAMRHALETRAKGDVPSRAQIEAQLGVFSSPEDGTESKTSRK